MAANASKSGSDSTLEADLEKLYRDVSENDLFPFWATTTDVVNDEIKQLMASAKAVPHLWSYKSVLSPLLEKSAELISTANSERRSLILCNPGLKPKRATVSTMYSSYRLNDPNEVMPPHRHSPNAIRFGLTGNMNFTGVEGEDITFGPGDMVLTPHDTWHNHGNHGDEPAVNLSVLDLPLVETLNAVYFEHNYKEKEGDAAVKKEVQSARFPNDYSTRIYHEGGFMPRFVSHYRGTGAASPMFVYRWEQMEALLDKHSDWDGSPYEGIVVEYVDPTSGGPIFKTMTFFMQMLRPGEKTLPVRQTASLLVSPFKGKVTATVAEQKFDCAEFDTLAVPGDIWASYENKSTTQPAVLFVASDEPTLKALGYFKKVGRDAEGDVVDLT